jgi:hypothetical protein
LFGVPAHLYRQAAGDALQWLVHAVRARFDQAFWYETRLRFFSGFLRERRRDFLRGGGGTIADVAAFARSFATRTSNKAGSAIQRF